MCLNLPFEVKNQLTFCKVRWFRYNFSYSVYSMFKNFWDSANVLLQLPFKMGKNEENFESSIFFEASKYCFVFWSILVFFQMVIFATLFRRCPTLWKSKLKMTTLFRRCLTLFNPIMKNTTLFQRCSTL